MSNTEFTSDSSEESESIELPSEIKIGTWSDYFSDHFIEETERGAFSIYTKGLEPDTEQPVIIFHHGAGYSALSFSLLTRELSNIRPNLAIISIDCLAHGETRAGLFGEEDLSITNLVDDFIEVFGALQRQWTAPHVIFLAGHSLGGSIVVRAAVANDLDDGRLIKNLVGVVVIDIVEETAIRALYNMPTVLALRPDSFDSPEEAIRWALLDNGISRNLEAASISIPSQLKKNVNTERWEWKIDLVKSKKHWQGWFEGLSNEFVQCKASRLLVLAEREYLDRPLMIASMQGKFQCSIIRDTGHAIQEDRPAELAAVIDSFIDRNLLIISLNQQRQQINR